MFWFAPISLHLGVQFTADDFNFVMVHQADDVGGADFDGAAVHHHVYGMFEGFPEVVGFVDVFVAEFCSGT